MVLFVKKMEQLLMLSLVKMKMIQLQEFSNLLIHLSADQSDKKAAKVIEGENLDVTLGNMPLFGEEKDAVKANVLKLLKEKYDIEEEDFVSAEN